MEVKEDRAVPAQIAEKEKFLIINAVVAAPNTVDALEGARPLIIR